MYGLYGTSCTPLNMYLVWGTLAILTAIIAFLLTLRDGKPLTKKGAVLTLVVSVVVVVVVAGLFKAMCTSAGGEKVAWVAVAVILTGTAFLLGRSDMVRGGTDSDSLLDRETRLLQRIPRLGDNLRSQ